MVRIGLIGDFNPNVRAHVAIPKSLEYSAARLGCSVEPHWVSTSSLKDCSESFFSGFSGFWCVPASPYQSMEGALRTIRFAREKHVPYLGTCGGFQHALIEYFRNVIGLKLADHTESNPATSVPVINALSCSLVGAKGKIRFQSDSRIAKIYGMLTTEEEYHCNFGFNSEFYSYLDSTELRITGHDENSEARVVELWNDHPFYLATLFQPELSAFRNVVHPVVTAFLHSAQTQ